MMGHGRAERTYALLLFIYRNFGQSVQFHATDLPEETRLCIGALLDLGCAKKIRRSGQKPLYRVTEKGMSLGKKLDKWAINGE